MMAASMRYCIIPALRNCITKRCIFKNRNLLYYPTNYVINGENRNFCRNLSYTQSFRSSAQAETSTEDYHTIIKDKEKAVGDGEKREFQADTRMLMDIVAKSLYSEKEIFIRELISNASDALEKFRYLSLTGSDVLEKDRKLEIHIATDKMDRTLIIQDTGVGLSKEDMISNLGTIARSGSKAFLQELQNQGSSSNVNSIIGQFGVGFYSCFMVSDKVEVYSKASGQDAKGHVWTADGSGTYEIREADGVAAGTKIVIYLKPECREFSDDDTVKGIIKKYSNFIGHPIFIDGKQINTMEALWLKEPKEVTPDMHEEFYRFATSSYDRPRFTLHYQTDSPLNIRCLLYVPESKPGMFDLNPNASESGVSLYCRKVLIKGKAENLLPKWLRFVKGVVDSEDIPLNLSRELLQDSALIRKLRTVLTNRMLRFLYDKARKEPENYDKFFKEYGVFMKEGILASQDQHEKEEIGKLLQYESSLKPEGEKVSLMDYCSRRKEGQKDIFYLAAPNRQLAESSPYFEALAKKDVEVLFCYENYDEIVLINLHEFDRSKLVSVEKMMRTDKEDVKLDDLRAGSLSKENVESLTSWIKATLGQKVLDVKVTERLSTYPSVITVEDMASARHFVRAQQQNIPIDQRYMILSPTLEVNPSHPVIKKLSELKATDPELAQLLAEQVYDNAMVAAGLVEDPRSMVTRLNQLLTKLVENR